MNKNEIILTQSQLYFVKFLLRLLPDIFKRYGKDYGDGKIIQPKPDYFYSQDYLWKVFNKICIQKKIVRYTADYSTLVDIRNFYIEKYL